MTQLRGLSAPVIVPAEINLKRDYSSLSLGSLIDMRPEELASIDPLAMNLVVAKGIPELAYLDITAYQIQLNK